MNKRISLGILFYAVFMTGCTFTDRDYELQEKAYRKDRAVKEEQQKDTLHMVW